MKDLVERHNKKCNEYELMEENVSNLRSELDQAKETINIQNKVTEEAKENHLKYHLLEEQMEVGILLKSHFRIPYHHTF